MNRQMLRYKEEVDIATWNNIPWFLFTLGKKREGEKERERERKECVYIANGDEKQSNLCKKN